MRLIAYFDDSGKVPDSPVQVIAGYVAPEAAWDEFTYEWRSILEACNIEAFRMAQAWRLSAEYRKLGPIGRDQLIVKLVESIKKYVEAAFAISVDLDAYSHWFCLEKSNELQAFRPYTHLFYKIQILLYDYLYNLRADCELEVVFDVQGGESEAKILAGMAEFRKLGATRWGELPVSTPSFQRDEVAVPIQAADLLAWLIRRDAMNASRQTDRTQLPESIILGEALSMQSFVSVEGESLLERQSEVVAELIEKNVLKK